MDPYLLALRRGEGDKLIKDDEKRSRILIKKFFLGAS